MQTTGSIVFEPGVSARTFPSVPSNVTPAMIINSSSNVGIGTATPGVALDVVGAGRFTAVSTNTLSTNQVNSSNICNAGWISNNGVFSNITAGAFFQATSNTTTLGVGGILTAASNISQTGGTTILSGLSVNTISTNQVNSSNICNAGWISNNGVFSNITAGAFFQATSNTGTLGVGGILTAASNITQNGGTTVLSGLSVNTISTNTINGNLGRFTDISTNTISTNIVTGSVVGRLPANTLAASVSPLAVVNGNAYLSFSPQIEFQYNSGGYKHFMGSRHQGDTANSFGNAVDFWLYSATTGGSNASTTPGTCNVNTMSVTAQGVGIFNNSPTLALDVTGTGRFQMLSTQQIYVSSISSGSVYGQFIGDGSLLTGLPSGGSGGLPISTNNTTLTDPASIIIKTPNTSYFYADYTNLTNYITISNYGAANGDYINIVNTGNSGTPATFQVLDGSTGASTIIRYIYPGHAGVVAYSGGQWWPL
jgi:hypothetical protein